MLLTLTTTHNPATDLGFLLHKNPANLHSFDLSFGKAHVFYPEATADLSFGKAHVFYHEATAESPNFPRVPFFNPFFGSHGA
jgi:hypothetical protein